MSTKFAASVLGIVLMTAPALTLADTPEDMYMKIQHVLGQIATIHAERNGAPVACALVATKQSVAVGESFQLIWNSFGANDPAEGGAMSQWARGGATRVIVSEPGVRTYRFNFYSKGGARAICETKVAVTPAQ